MELDNRHGAEATGRYRYGYQGSEHDDEIKGNGNSYTTQYRFLDPRLGRWLSLDALSSKYPSMSPYTSMNNSPITTNDVTGTEGTDWIKRVGSTNWEYHSGVQSQAGATARFGEGTGYLDDGGTYQGTLNGKSVGTVTVHTGGLKTWEGGSFENKDINPLKQGGNSGCMNFGMPMTTDVAATDKNGKYLDGHGMHYLDRASPHFEEWSRQIKKWETFDKGFATYMVGMLALPLVLEATPFLASYASTTANIGWRGVQTVGNYTWRGAKLYHNTFGKMGGYQSLTGEAITQVSGQIAQGNYNPYTIATNLDLIGIGTSAFVRSDASFLTKFVQGNLGTAVSYSLEGGFDGALVKDKSNAWIGSSLIIGTYGTFGPGGYVKDYFMGTFQGTIDKMEEDKSKK